MRRVRRNIQRDRYLFDKRIIKKSLIKYGIMFLVGLPILIVLNVYAFKDLSFWAITFADVGVLLGIVLIGLIIYNKIEATRLAKIKEQQEKERELAKARKRAKRVAKKDKNQNKIHHEVTDVEIEEPNVKE